ncbi:hypothetical protein [Streptomyces sp. NPDC004267]|uniref:hypothetical protein n=1 Tax=Streptomyces sp. NPDC004267 TaxID=3364694 RepID=UPI0036BE80C4
MEQRNGPSMQAVHGAATDPAFVPGITGATGVEPDAPREPADEPADAVVADEPGDAVVADGEPDSAEETVVDGPVFEAADRRARIVADATGVRLSLDEESCDFRWDEIGAVETATARFGKRLSVTVHTPNRRWYTADVDASSKDRVKEWESLLDAVLDAYFDENAESNAESAVSAVGALRAGSPESD